MSNNDVQTPKTAILIGEALVDLIQRAGEEGEPEAHPGGSPLNVALTLGRLGQTVRLATAFGDDPYGRMILNHLHQSDVDLAEGSYILDRTPTALAKLDESGSATYVFDLEWALPGGVPLREEPAFVHVGSISTTSQPGGATVLEVAQQAAGATLVSYDPNVRPTIMPPVEETRALVEEYVKAANLVKVSDEDLAWLYPDLSPAEVVAKWFELSSVALVVVTEGGSGPTAWTSGGVKVSRPPESVKVADTVGAGDSFMGGLLDALWRRGLVGRVGAENLADLTEAEVGELLDEANEVASVTVSRAGANPPWAWELGR